MTNLQLRLNQYFKTLINTDTYNYNHNITNTKQSILNKLFTKFALTIGM